MCPQKLQRFAQTSTPARLYARGLLNKLNTSIYNQRVTQLAISFIDTFLQTVEEYNEPQTDSTCRLTDWRIQQLVQQSVSVTDKLALVKLQDMVRFVQRMESMDFQLCFQSLRHEVTLLDEQKFI